jgi:hypothetical protein
MADPWRFLRKHALWEEIELRLRHRWTGSDVQAWLTRESQPTIDGPLLEQYRRGQPASWSVPLLTDTPPGRRCGRLLALEVHAEVVSAQLTRTRRFLDLEKQLALPLAEARTNMQLLSEMLVEHVGLAQRLGMLPTAPTRLEAIVATGTTPEAELIALLKDLPSSEFLALAVETQGPPGRRDA